MNAFQRPHWSYSAISQFLSCPLRFYFQRVLRLPQTAVSSNLLLGSAVHHALAVYPRELLPWEEGSTQVDVCLSWENPPTTVYIEMKYGSDLSASTSRNHGEHGFPADQLSRNARVGLLECGYFQRPQLFPTAKRDFILLVVSPEKGHPLVARYRDPIKLNTV